MEVSPSKEKIVTKWRAANQNPTDRDIARREVLLSNLSSDAKLFAVAVIEFGGMEVPIALPRREAQIILSKSKDGFASAAEKFGEWLHAEVDKGESGQKHRYRILQNVLAPAEKAACSSGRFSEDLGKKAACPTGRSDEKAACPTGRFLIDRGDKSSQSKGGVVFFAETATTTGVSDGERTSAKTPQPGEPDSRQIESVKHISTNSNSDESARGLNGAPANDWRERLANSGRPVADTPSRPGKWGARDPFGLNPLTKPAEASVGWREDGRLWVANGFSAELSSILPEGQDLQINLDAVAQYVPGYETGIGLMKAVRTQIVRRAETIKRIDQDKERRYGSKRAKMSNEELAARIEALKGT